jgi:hypothetical protein
MKVLGFILVLPVTMLTVTSASNVFSVKTSLNISSSVQSYGISVASGDILEFSAEDLEMRLELKPQSLSGITVTALPQHGELVLDGVAVDLFEYIPRGMIDNLCFVPGDKTAAANMSIIPRAPYSERAAPAELAISVLAGANLPPEIENTSYNTIGNVPVSGHITAYDPEGDTLNIRVITPPVNGTVRFDGLNFRYVPFKDVHGKDSFTICAIDSANNFSNKATVSIDIEKPRAKFFYTDMQTHPSAYAAIKLREKKVMTGTQIGGRYFFSPDDATTRGEFLVMLIAAGGLEKSMKPAVNTGLPNDSGMPHWLKPYVKKALDEGILPPEEAFLYDETPSRAEAVFLTDRTAKITDVKDYILQMDDAGGIPAWSVPSYKNLAAYKMLDLHDNMARPLETLTNSYSADLIWQLWKHCNK